MPEAAGGAGSAGADDNEELEGLYKDLTRLGIEDGGFYKLEKRIRLPLSGEKREKDRIGRGSEIKKFVAEEFLESGEKKFGHNIDKARGITGISYRLPDLSAKVMLTIYDLQREEKKNPRMREG